MPFTFTTPFPATDPDQVPHFTRSFEHIDWIDGDSVVQAGTTQGEDGFNLRFRRIIADLEALGDDSRRALLSGAAMRASIHAMIEELKAELTRLSIGVEGWHQVTAFANGWRFVAPDGQNPYSQPSYFRDQSGVVHFKGTLSGGAPPSAANGNESTIFQLPEGYRPNERIVVPVFGGTGSVARLDIRPDGWLSLRSPIGNFLSLSGITFRADKLRVGGGGLGGDIGGGLRDGPPVMG